METEQLEAIGTRYVSAYVVDADLDFIFLVRSISFYCVFTIEDKDVQANINGSLWQLRQVVASSPGAPVLPKPPE